MFCIRRVKTNSIKPTHHSNLKIRLDSLKLSYVRLPKKLVYYGQTKNFPHLINMISFLGPTDIIRQLNIARSQGLVVLQQWGDKQV